MALDFVEEELEGEVFKDSPRPRKKGKEYDSVTLRTAKARLTRVLRLNQKLALEVATLKGSLVPLKTMKAEVIKANLTVKSQLMALPSRVAMRLSGMTDARQIEQLLRAEITEALNELAYGFGAQDRDGTDEGDGDEED